MEIEIQLVPDRVRFAGFENCVPAVTAAAEGSSAAIAAPGQGIPLLWMIGGVAAVLCVTFCIAYHVHRSNDEERSAKP